MERRMRYSIEGQRLGYTPQTEYAAELRMELRMVEAYAKALRLQIRDLISPRQLVQSNGSFRQMEERARQANEQSDAKQMAPPYEQLQQ